MTASNLAPIRFASVSQVTATLGSNDPQVGDRCEEGGNSYVFVYNNGTSQISPGYGATVTAATGYSCTVSTVTNNDWLIGVCKNATITTNTYGWLVTRGFVTVIMGTVNSAAAGGYVGLGADGTFAAVATSANTDTVVPTRFGKYMSAAASAASVGCYIHCFT